MLRPGPSVSQPTDLSLGGDVSQGNRHTTNALDNMAGWNAVTLLYFIVHLCFSSVVAYQHPQQPGCYRDVRSCYQLQQRRRRSIIILTRGRSLVYHTTYGERSALVNFNIIITLLLGVGGRCLT